MKIPEGCIFYQTIELPGFGVLNGSWDHRNSTPEYLGHVKFNNKTVLDVGPANGYFSFEMENRGAAVTAVELGQGAEWDMVPNPNLNKALAKSARENAVSQVENAFWFCHKILTSEVKLIYGSAYDTPSIVDQVDIALMGNILQHLRDPFKAIEQVAKVVDETIIISESLWDESPEFLRSTGMRLIPRADFPEIDHSWWQVSPPLVIEILRLLGFGNIKSEFHDQVFYGTNADQKPKMVKHFTVTGERLNHIFLKGWHEEETDGHNTWRWSSDRHADVLIKFPHESETKGNIEFELISANPTEINVIFNGSTVWSGTVKDVVIPVSIRGINLRGGGNRLEFISSSKTKKASISDDREIGFAVYNFRKDFG